LGRANSIALVVKILLKNLAGLLVGFILAVLSVWILELAAGWALTHQKQNIPQEDLRMSRGFRFPDSDLGYRPLPNQHHAVWKQIDGKTIYQAVYTMDPFGRRVTPTQKRERRNQFLLFFGGSTTLGEGVQNKETLPFWAGTLAEKHTPYNYGFSGYGPQQMLAILESGRLKQEIQEKKGIAIYSFIDGHVNRAIGDMHVFNAWAGNAPFYVLEDGQVVRKGSFLSGRPWLSKIYRFLGQRNLVRYFKINHPIRIHGEHIRLTAKMFEKAQDMLQEQFPGSDFYVLFWPGWTEFKDRLQKELDELGVPYWDYSELLDREAPDMMIEGDGIRLRKPTRR